METARDKRALVIGINNYPLLAARHRLHGCVNDAKLMAHLIHEHYGFPTDNINVLLNERATRDRILAAFDALVEQARGGDSILIHYSGHGSQMTDREGDEPDGMDETIVPHDSGRRPHPNRDITDDEIYARLLRLTDKTQNVTLVFDSCHSGTITRDPFGSGSRWVEPDDRPVEELPPSPVEGLEMNWRGAAARDLGASGWLPLDKRYVLLAGCRDEESAYEFKVEADGEEVTHGAFTYFLSRELIRAEPGTTYRDVFERICHLVAAQFPRQHPQIEGTIDREVFGVHDIAPMRFVPVTACGEGGALTLGAGAAHGMTAGSQWAIYPEGAKRGDDETSRLGLALVADVSAFHADARVLEESTPGAIVKGARAVEHKHCYGELRLRVEVFAVRGFERLADELSRLVSESDLLLLVEPGGAADARVNLLAPRKEAREGDPAPQLGGLSKPAWAVVGRDGRLMMPVHGADEAHAPSLLRENLEKEARYRHTLALGNPESRLSGQVELRLKRKTNDGAWEDARPEENGGQVVFLEGDRLALEVFNNYDEPIYISIFDFGLTSTVGLLYPVTGAAERLVPHTTFTFGVREGEEIELFMPENFPYASDPDDGLQEGGLETLKLFATTSPADFRHLVQEGFRSLDRREGAASDSPLDWLLSVTLTGHGTRDAKVTRLPPRDEWTTVEKSFFLFRR